MISEEQLTKILESVGIIKVSEDERIIKFRNESTDFELDFCKNPAVLQRFIAEFVSGPLIYLGFDIFGREITSMKGLGNSVCSAVGKLLAETHIERMKIESRSKYERSKNRYSTHKCDPETQEKDDKNRERLTFLESIIGVFDISSVK